VGSGVCSWPPFAALSWGLDSSCTKARFPSTVLLLRVIRVPDIVVCCGGGGGRRGRRR
jgi:hypothetical protein